MSKITDKRKCAYINFLYKKCIIKRCNTDKHNNINNINNTNNTNNTNKKCMKYSCKSYINLLKDCKKYKFSKKYLNK
jgi:hypothetical protein